ncbi:MAG: hypothetical protein Unbinned3459contig1000_19 [Prokaryotic dsDNA virus sp.]|jgi:hypothetical protein|nr:MAG: hypothetical protein Unbinned3459contig1000_19 [Prokaryotic dsDNA virus sp.]|tara:strand:+ start:33160 stop:34239 length:1080 start_codon:yes stop_codon:yes gene_type:complete
MGLRTDYLKGWQKAVSEMGTRGDRGHSVLPITQGARKFYKGLADQGVTTETPVQLAGAMGARLLTDVGEDATRHLYWRYNHPMALADKLAEQAIGDRLLNYTPTQRAAISLAAVGVPVSASLGTFDATNIGELGRPKGFAQTYAEQGSEDRRQTGQIAPELLDRFVLGRQGRPLKFETAKEDIPDLTKQRYANYMDFLYNEKGPLGVGIIKGTMENLQGEPEARIVGFPVGLQAVGALTGGALATGAALRQQTPETVPGGIGPKQPRTIKTEDTSESVPGKKYVDKQVYREGDTKVKRGKSVTNRMGSRTDYIGPKTRTLALMGGAGALTGALAGKLANTLLASTGQSDLPTTQEYGIS